MARAAPRPGPDGRAVLRFWHMQNQPAERPDGGWTPDVFRGQVLSLHPCRGSS
ncbi:MAG: hypothetical protein WKF75_02530 [Singulisphaera sp.]